MMADKHMSMEENSAKRIRARERLMLGVLVIWALLGLWIAYDPAVEGLSLLFMLPPYDNVQAMAWGGIRSNIGLYLTGGFWLVQALLIITAGCCAVIPHLRTRRIAWGLYGSLLFSALLLPIADGALRARGINMGTLELWGGKRAWFCPEAAWLGGTFGFGGLALLELSWWLCPNLFGKGRSPGVRPLSGRQVKVRYTLGFINLIAGGGSALVGLLLLLAWGYLGIRTSPPSPLFGFFEIPVLGLGLLICFGLVAYSGVELLRNTWWSLRVACAACLVTLVWGSILFYLEIESHPAPSWRANDIVSSYVESLYEDALMLIPWYLLYGAISAPMLLLGRKGRRMAVVSPDSQPEGMHV